MKILKLTDRDLSKITGIPLQTLVKFKKSDIKNWRNNVYQSMRALAEGTNATDANTVRLCTDAMHMHMRDIHIGIPGGPSNRQLLVSILSRLSLKWPLDNLYSRIIDEDIKYQIQADFINIYTDTEQKNLNTNPADRIYEQKFEDLYFNIFTKLSPEQIRLFIHQYPSYQFQQDLIGQNVNDVDNYDPGWLNSILLRFWPMRKLLEKLDPELAQSINNSIVE